MARDKTGEPASGDCLQVATRGTATTGRNAAHDLGGTELPACDNSHGFSDHAPSVGDILSREIMARCPGRSRSRRPCFEPAFPDVHRDQPRLLLERWQSEQMRTITHVSRCHRGAATGWHAQRRVRF